MNCHAMTPKINGCAEAGGPRPTCLLSCRLAREQEAAAEAAAEWAAEPKTILAEAAELVDADRQVTYGHPRDDFAKTALMWSAIFGVDVTVEQVALAMCCVKISRLLQTPDHRDSVVDLAGYARTYEKVVWE